MAGTRLESRSIHYGPGRSSAQHRSVRSVISALRRPRARGDQVRSGRWLADRHRPVLDDRGAGRLESLPQAVHVEARAAQVDDGGLWLADLKRCDVAAAAASTLAPPRRRIVYEQADRDARDLAARLVGLAALGRGAVVAGLA